MRWVFVALLSCFCVTSAIGQTNNEDFDLITVCSGFEGHAYFVSGRLVTSDKTGWGENRLPGYLILLIQWKDDQRYDLFYKGNLSEGKIMPFTMDGASVSFLRKLDPHGYLFSVVYEKEKVTEIGTYHFDLNFMNDGELLFAQQRRNGVINSMFAMTALCVGRETASLHKERP